MPRKGPKAIELRKAMGLTPKQYRKLLVGLTDVVETKMCANEWDKINFSHVPSLAAARYRKAFNTHLPEKFATYVEALQRGDADVKVNTAAVFPYDVLKGRIHIPGYGGQQYITSTERKFIIEQWKALPNYVGDASFLPMVDVSGSMMGQPLEVAVSLGLYLADKNTGPFKDTFLTFSAAPELLHLGGDVLQKIDMMVDSKWGQNTNIIRAFAKILEVAKRGGVTQEDMPKVLLILSDMQFDYCARFDDSALESARRQFEEAGYELPSIIFWNLADKAGVPARANSQGVGLVSGFSPTIVKSLLSDPNEFTPEGIMLKTVMVDRYAI
jgi:hypothetical protein